MKTHVVYKLIKKNIIVYFLDNSWTTVNIVLFSCWCGECYYDKFSTLEGLWKRLDRDEIIEALDEIDKYIKECNIKYNDDEITTILINGVSYCEDCKANINRENIIKELSSEI